MRRNFVFLILFFAGLSAPSSQAGVFNLYHFVQPGGVGLGIEPELTLTRGANLGGNLKTTFGLSELFNAQLFPGLSDGKRSFRLGGALVFDFIPDLEDQPGIGIAAQGTYFSLLNSSEFEFLVIPYIHKSFKSGETILDPFFALSGGLLFSTKDPQWLWSIAVGSMFKVSPSLGFVGEIGVSIHNATTYVSGGVVYYF